MAPRTLLWALAALLLVASAAAQPTSSDSAADRARDTAIAAGATPTQAEEAAMLADVGFVRHRICEDLCNFGSAARDAVGSRPEKAGRKLLFCSLRLLGTLWPA